MMEAGNLGPRRKKEGDLESRSPTAWLLDDKWRNDLCGTDG